MALSRVFDYNSNVLSLSPTLVEIESPDTRNLLELARAGDAEAFGEICHAYEGRLLRQAFMLCGDAALAEDLAQEALVQAWKCLHRYNGRCQFLTWLCAILLNQCRNTLRRTRARPFSGFPARERDEFQDQIANLPDRDSTPDVAAQNHEQAAQVRACIQSLPPKQQRVIYLRFYVDDSLEGIAAALGCSVGTVKSRLFHALENLRRMNVLKGQTANSTMKGSTL